MEGEKLFNLKNLSFVFGMLGLIIVFDLSYGFYTNTNRYFEQGRTADGYGGNAMLRDSSDFIEDGCGADTVLDTTNGLCWQKNMGESGSADWWNSVNFCAAKGFRMPTATEMITLFNEIGSTASASYLCNELTIYGFYNCGSTSFYWTSTDNLNSASSAWRVYTSSGSITTNGKSNSYYVLCVKNY